MPLLQFIPIRYFLFLVLGIVLGDRFSLDRSVGFWICGAALLILFLIYLRGNRTRDLLFEMLTALSITGIGISALAGSFSPNRPDHYSRIHVPVESMQLKIREELRSSDFNNRFVAEVQWVNDREVSGNILLYTPNSIHLEPDREMVVLKSWQPIQTPKNPGQFNYKKYMARQDIYDQVRVGMTDFVLLEQIRPTLLGRLRIMRNDIRIALLETKMAPETVATIEALLLGERQHLDRDLYDAYKDAGAVHILAVSGLHIGILLMLLRFVFRPLRRFPRGNLLHWVAVLISLWGYALFTGLSPSVVRAVTLFSFISYAWVINRPANMYNTLALSFFFVLLAIRPTYLFQAGFQMSYAAVLAIVWLYPIISGWWKPRNILVKRIRDLLAVSLAAQIGVLPISLFYFHQFPGLFFLSNLLILPFLALILGFGFVLILLTFLDWQLDPLVRGFDMMIQTMNGLVIWIGGQEAFVFRDIPFDEIRLLLAYLFLITLIYFFERRRFNLLIGLAAIVLLFQGWTGYRAWDRKISSKLILFHSYQNTLLVERQGNDIRTFSRENTPYLQRLVQDFSLLEGGEKIAEVGLQNAYQWGGNRLLVLDSTTQNLPDSEPSTHIILTQNAKVNLDRILQAHPNAKILADGSNYPSMVALWRTSCEKKKRIFHYTGEKGAYCFISTN